MNLAQNFNFYRRVGPIEMESGSRFFQIRIAPTQKDRKPYLVSTVGIYLEHMHPDSFLQYHLWISLQNLLLFVFLLVTRSINREGRKIIADFINYFFWINNFVFGLFFTSLLGRNVGPAVGFTYFFFLITCIWTHPAWGEVSKIFIGNTKTQLTF